MAKRTVSELGKLKGKVYVYFASKEIGDRFREDAEREGCRFGKIKPTELGCCGVVAIHKHKQLSAVGFVGHMEFQCDGGLDYLIRVDYEKYIRGDKDFLFKNPSFSPLTIKGRFFDEVTIVSPNAEKAASFLSESCMNCKDAKEELELHGEAEKKFDVSIFTEED